MNNKFLKILTGFSAMAVAGLLSLAPATNVSAATIPVDGTNILYWVEDESGWTGTEIPGASGSISYSGTGTDNVWSAYIWVDKGIDIPAYVYAEISFYQDINSASSGNAEFEFVLNGKTYRGSFALDIIDDNFISTSTIYYLSQFAVPDSTPLDEFYNDINNTVNDIGLAAKGFNADGSANPDKTVYYNCKGAINYRIIKELAKTEGVTLVYTFEYKGYVFTATITSEDAAKIFSEGIIWYGPCYIANYCPTVLVDVVK